MKKLVLLGVVGMFFATEAVANDKLNAERLSGACPHVKNLTLLGATVSYHSEPGHERENRKCLAEAWQRIQKNPYPVNMGDNKAATRVRIGKGGTIILE